MQAQVANDLMGLGLIEVHTDTRCRPYAGPVVEVMPSSWPNTAMIRLWDDRESGVEFDARLRGLAMTLRNLGYAVRSARRTCGEVLLVSAANA